MILEDAPVELQPAAPRRSYTLFLLTLVYVVNYLDRQILGILLPFIQHDFHLDDAQAGLLSGTVFAVVYASLGIPLASLADRFSRRNIIAGSLAIFSFMTVLSGYAVRYWQLLLARFGTGIGEAGTAPAISSMIADLYPPQQRATALAFYSAGLNVGLLVGFFAGGVGSAAFRLARSLLCLRGTGTATGCAALGYHRGASTRGGGCDAGSRGGALILGHGALPRAYALVLLDLLGLLNERVWRLCRSFFYPQIPLCVASHDARGSRCRAGIASGSGWGARYLSVRGLC